MFLSPFDFSATSPEFLAAEAEAQALGDAYLAFRSSHGPDAEGAAELREAFRAATAKVDALRAASR